RRMGTPPCPGISAAGGGAGDHGAQAADGCSEQGDLYPPAATGSPALDERRKDAVHGRKPARDVDHRDAESDGFSAREARHTHQTGLRLYDDLSARVFSEGPLGAEAG